MYFLGGKGGRYVRLTTLPPSSAVVMKSGNLNFLEPSGPLQACNGTALPSSITYIINPVTKQKSQKVQSVEEKKDIGQSKGKAVPLQAWSGPEGSR